MPIKINNVNITINRLGGANITSEKLNGGIVWPTNPYQPATKGSVQGWNEEVYPGGYALRVRIYNPNPFPIQIQWYQYTNSSSSAVRSGTTQCSASGYTYIIDVLQAPITYPWKVNCHQSWSPNAQEYQGKNEMFSYSAQSSNYVEDTSTTTTTT